MSSNVIRLALPPKHPFRANSFCRSFCFRDFKCLVSDYGFIFLYGLQPVLFLGAFHSFPVRQRVSFRARERICHHRGIACFPYVSGSLSEPVSAYPSSGHRMLPVRQRVSFRARERICHYCCCTSIPCHASCNSSCFDAFCWAELFFLFISFFSAACSCLPCISAILTAYSTVSHFTGF